MLQPTNATLFNLRNKCYNHCMYVLKHIEHVLVFKRLPIRNIDFSIKGCRM